MSDTGADKQRGAAGAPGPPKPESGTASAGEGALDGDATQPMPVMPPEAQTLKPLEKDMQLGDFRILRRLGRGGMADVFLAEQISLKRSVAIKVMRPGSTSDPSYVKRFQTEAHAAAGLNHPNIVQVYTVGEADGMHFIAQEYVQGQNLREYLQRQGPPDFAVAVHIMRQTAAALQAAHDAGLVHRDIKPENILLTRKGDVKVADFGLAKVMQTGATPALNLTQVGMTMGTPLYMSPEQVNGSKLDHRSDLYSFGVTCYHMLAGEPPFRGDTALSVAVKHIKEEAAPLDRLRPDLPPMLCKIVQKMMAKDPAKRYSSGAAIIKDLKRLAQEQKTDDDETPAALVEEKSAAESPEPVATSRWGAWLALADVSWRQQIPWLLASVVVVGGAAAALGWATRPTSPLKTPAVIQEEVPLQDSAAAQFEYAKTRATDHAAWKAVIDYFPNDSYFRPQAELELALLNVTQDRLDDADLYFKELRAYGDWQPQWRASGLVGQGVILSLRKDHAQSQQILRQPGGPRQRLDPRLQELVNQAIERNEQAAKSGASAPEPGAPASPNSF